MSLENRIYETLFASATLVGVTTCIYPDKIPPQIILPAISYQRIAGVREWTLNGYASLENVRVQFNIYASSLTEKVEITSLLINALTSSALFVAVANNAPIDYYNDETGLYSRNIDISIWNYE